MSFQFTNALEAQRVYNDYWLKLHDIECVRHKKDIWTLMDNIRPMINQLSDMEIVRRQKHKHRGIPDQINRIVKSLEYIDKLVLICQLSE